jgi:GT2 family glycosyltransferase
MVIRMGLPLVHIIIVNWNGLKDTLECLESLERLEYPNFEVVLVDNGSTDGSPTLIKAKYPNLFVIENRNNVGYGKANNLGIEYALRNGANYVWLLNNDAISDPRALSNMVQVAEEDPKIGILGSKIYYASDPERIWFAGAGIDWAEGFSSHIGINETDKGQYDSLRGVERVAGCSMLVRREVCEQVGVFDENYFLFVEEIDWCVRARKQGFRCVLVPSSIVYHKGSASVSRIGNWSSVYNYYNTRNFLYLVRKSFCFPKRDFFLLLLIARKILRERLNILRVLLYRIEGRKKITVSEFPVLFGIRDFLFNRMGEADYSFGSDHKK